MTRTLAIICALTVASLGARPRESRDLTLVGHDFSTSTHGWLIAGDTGMGQPTFHPAGGDPGGYISNEDEAVGETWYFRAPADVVARLSAAEQGSLSFTLKQSQTDAGFPDDDVVIVGPAGRLSYQFGSAPGETWTDFSVRLSASAGWRWNWNREATQDQIRSVLVNASRLEIRGEYRTGPDVGALDNFVLTAAE
jgi:alkaline phosphatase D